MRSSLRPILLAGTLAVLAVPSASAVSPDELDPAWGENGVRSFPETFSLRGSVLAADGSLITSIHGGSTELVRLDLQGRIDQRFGNDGYLKPCGWCGFLNQFALLPDGRIVTVNSDFELWPTIPQRLTRFHPDGRPDLSLGPEGLVQLSVVNRAKERKLLASDASGRAYFVTVVGPIDLHLQAQEELTWIVRVGPAGAVEAEFGHFGSTVPGSDPSPRSYKALRIQPDGRVVAAVTGPEQGLVVIRYLASGELDSTFGAGGIAVAPTSGPGSSEDLALLSDGGMIVVGGGEVAGQRVIAVARLDARGKVDATFGDGGIVYIRVAPISDTVAFARIARASDGKLVISATLRGEFAPRRPHYRVAVVRLHPDGRRDTLFAPGGRTTVSTSQGLRGFDLLVRPGGEIVIGGITVDHFQNGAHVDYVGGHGVILQLRGGNGSVDRPRPEALAVEYHHIGFGHFFLTADPKEIATLDKTPIPWVRSGYTIRVWSDPDPALSPVCRFWSGQSYVPKSSHFYTPYVTECASLKEGTVWKYEGDAFYVGMPEGIDGARTCPKDTQPLYRTYNNGLTGAPNHRYTTESWVVDGMISQGYAVEGEALTRVFACVPIQ